MEGILDKLVAVQKKGVFGVARFTGQELLGSSPGARKRVKAWLTLPPASQRVERAFLTLGFEAAQGTRFPVKSKVSLDESVVARELRPQFIVELDESIYFKSVYDITPTHASKLASRDYHKLMVVYDAMRPLYLRDATLLVFYGVEGVMSSVSMLTGAKVLEPGEVTVEYPEFFRSIGGEREASLIIHSPYHEASFEVVVAGSAPVRVSGMGGFVVSTRFSYEGSLIPVSVKYLRPKYNFYPRKAVITDVCVCEAKLPQLSISLKKVRVETRNGRVVVSGAVVNESGFDARRVAVSLVGGGSQLAGKRIELVPAGGERSFELVARIDNLPIRPERLVLSVRGYILSREVSAYELIEM